MNVPRLPKKPINGYTIHWWRVANNQAGLPDVFPGKATYRHRDRCWFIRNGGNTFSTSGGWKAPLSWIWTRDFETEALALAEARRLCQARIRYLMMEAAETLEHQKKLGK